MNTSILDRMAAAVGPGIGLVVDGCGKPLSAVMLRANGAPVDRAPCATPKELDALWRARRVFAGGAS